MKVFVTGASGFIGSAVVPELLGAGHTVLGLVRSESAAQALTAAGAEAHFGSLEDLDSLSRGAASSDGVIHLAFSHDMSKFAESSEIERRAIEALGGALQDTGRPLLVTSGVALLAPGRIVTEEDTRPYLPSFPRDPEQAALALASQGVRVSVLRMSQIHNTVKQGLVTYLVATAREKGISAYVGDGTNRWSAAHIHDVAQLYRLALEKQEAGATYHAVGEEGVPLRDIAEAIGRGLNVPAVSLSPEEAEPYFGFLSAFAGLDMPASSAQTQEKLGWHPAGPRLVADLEQMNYAN